MSLFLNTLKISYIVLHSEANCIICKDAPVFITVPSGQAEMPRQSVATHDLGIIPIPRWLRYNAERQSHFSLALNIAFGFVSTFGM
jgi:hypothetical protein